MTSPDLQGKYSYIGLKNPLHCAARLAIIRGMKMLSPERKASSKPIENAPNALRAFRLHRRAALETVAEACGCAFQNLSTAERKGGKLGLDVWLALSDYYGVPVQVLRDPNSDPQKFVRKIKPKA